jgi:hypothetical protein
MTAIPAKRDHRERAEELLAAVAAQEDTGRELTAMAAIAEAMLAVADELEALRALTSVRPPGPTERPVPPGPILGEIGRGPFTWPPH